MQNGQSFNWESMAMRGKIPETRCVGSLLVSCALAMSNECQKTVSLSVRS
jgi:hypothetical protein